MRVHRDGLGLRVDVDAEEAAEGRRDDHGRRPQLVAGAAAEGHKIIAAEQLGHRAQVLRAGQIGVLHQQLIAGQRLVGAVLGQGRPAGKQRPHRALVIAHAVVKLLVGGDVAQAPVGVERVRGKLLQAALGVGQNRFP